VVDDLARRANRTSDVTAPAAITALLNGLIDYAGLFPPAALPMAEAARRYDEYRCGEHAWALGSFVVPVHRLDEVAALAAPLRGRGAPWLIAALGGPGDLGTIALFNARHGERAVVNSLEVKADTIAEIDDVVPLLAGAGSGPSVYVEFPLGHDPEPFVRSIHGAGLRAKIRTGGVTAALVPGAAQVARFLQACAAHDVIFKATAGLHHPVRGNYRLTYEIDSATSTMFGYLNVFLAALHARTGLSESSLIDLLEERDPRAFTFDDATASWRDHRLATAEILSQRRHFAASFGSCSFTEPLGELAELGLL
jgi:hypothetical protein